MSGNSPSDSDDSGERLSRDQVDDILDRAVELGEPPPAEPSLSLSELKSAATEAGIPASAVEAAASEVLGRGESEALPTKSLGLLPLVGALFFVGVLVLGGLGFVMYQLLGSAEELSPQHENQSNVEVEKPPQVTEEPERSEAPPSSTEREPKEGSSEPPQPEVVEAARERAASQLQPDLLSGEAAAQAQQAIQGSWALTSWVSGANRAAEIPAKSRPKTEAPPEGWEFFKGGRFRRTIGDNFTVGGRWTVTSRVPPSPEVAWLGLEKWWLIALDQVALSALPGQERPREWALVGQDGEERIIFYLGRSPELDERTMGGRFLPRVSD